MTNLVDLKARRAKAALLSGQVQIELPLEVTSKAAQERAEWLEAEAIREEALVRERLEQYDLELTDQQHEWGVGAGALLDARAWHPGPPIVQDKYTQDVVWTLTADQMASGKLTISYAPRRRHLDEIQVARYLSQLVTWQGSAASVVAQVTMDLWALLRPHKIKVALTCKILGASRQVHDEQEWPG